MAERELVKQAYLTGERPLFHAEHTDVYDTIFTDGESPLKESSDIRLYGSMFKWKYPLWYCNHIYAEDCTWLRWRERVYGIQMISR